MNHTSAAASQDAAAWERLLRTAGTKERAAQEKAYLKSDLEFAGVPVPRLRSMVLSWHRARPDLTGAELAGEVRALWASPLYECKQSAVLLCERCRSLLGAADIELIEELLRTSGTWALVDGLATNVAGHLVERFPQLTATLDRRATDQDLWIRRSALLALLVPLRPELLIGWPGPRVHRAAGITVREAVKPLPEPDRVRLVKGYQDRRPVRAHS